MPRGQRRYWLLRTVSAASLCLALCGSPASAQQKFSFDLPEQPLSASLKEYARVSGQQIIFTEDLVWGYVSKPLHGSLSAADALNQLLTGTDLFVEHTARGAVMIRRRLPGEQPIAERSGPARRRTTTRPNRSPLPA